MSQRLRAVVGISYPVGEDLELLEDAGGFRNLTPEQREGLDLRHVDAGGSCDDLPQRFRDWMIPQGIVEVVDDWPEDLPSGAVDGLEGAGIGPDDVAGLSDDELRAVPGVGRASVKTLRESFGGPGEESPPTDDAREA